MTADRGKYSIYQIYIHLIKETIIHL